MEKQLRFVSKEEAHKLIDDSPGNSVLILTYNNTIGMSEFAKQIKKKKSKNYVDKFKTLVLVDSRPILIINLHDKIIRDLKEYSKENISRSIMLAKLE